MVRKTYTPEQIIKKLGEAETHINQGISIAEASRKPVSPSRPTIAGVESMVACG